MKWAPVNVGMLGFGSAISSKIAFHNKIKTAPRVMGSMHIMCYIVSVSEQSLINILSLIN